jgi:signal transduction histidine kinase
MFDTRPIAPPGPSAAKRLVTGPAALAAGYLVAFVLLDWASYIRPMQGLNITPWNPQPALAVALLMRYPGWSALVWLGLVLAEYAVRDVQAGWPVLVVSAAFLTAVYGAMAWVLRRELRRRQAIESTRDVLAMTGTIAAGSLACAVCYVVIHGALGSAMTNPAAEGIVRYWIGDAVGLMVVLPILLLSFVDASRRRDLINAVRAPRYWCIAALVGVLVWAVFLRGSQDQSRLFYLLLLPIILAAVAYGIVGAVLTCAITQIGIVAAVQTALPTDLAVFEVQALLSVLAMTGMLLGVAVDQRSRADTELRRSLHLAAAGHMAAAIAHELSQPLTALGNYASVLRMRARGVGADISDPSVSQAELVLRIEEEARRSVDVVKRLRDFFRSGSTQLRTIDLGELIESAVRTQAQHARASSVVLRSRGDTELPPIMADPIQITVVLRNLLANAVEAAAGAKGAGWVEIEATAGRDIVRVEVRDNGSGIAVGRLRSIFEPGESTKPAGMGVGLSICRAIVEAHDGHLWAETGEGGCLIMTLPVDALMGAPTHDAS